MKRIRLVTQPSHLEVGNVTPRIEATYDENMRYKSPTKFGRINVHGIKDLELDNYYPR